MDADEICTRSGKALKRHHEVDVILQRQPRSAEKLFKKFQLGKNCKDLSR